jgi:integrase
MFTVKQIESLKPKDKPYRVFEKASRAGFGVQITPKGTKTFFYFYKTDDGKQRFMKLGAFGDISLKEAGNLWQKWHNIKQEGYDPQIVRDNEIRKTEEAHRQAEAEKKRLEQQGSYEQLLNTYIEDLKAKKKRSADNILQVFNANAYKVISKNRKAREVTPKEINETLAIVEKRNAHVLANRLRSYLLSAFKFGMQLEMRRTRTKAPIQFGISSNPVRDVLKSEVKEKPRDRFLSENEIKELWHTLSKTNISESIIAALKLMLITGQRVEEVLRININNIDEQEMTWELKETKAGRPHVVPLPNIAKQIIDDLKPDADGYLLPTPSTHQGLMKPYALSQACNRYCKQHGFKKFTPRDLRRTWKTLTGKAGISKVNRDRYQNHALNDVSSKNYDRYDYLAEKRQVASIWNDYLNNILFDEDQTVVPIRAKQ